MKLTKKQKEALESLIFDLDELTNKPRRLFSSLEKFAKAFAHKEMIPQIIADIYEWQDFYYKSIAHSNVLEDLGRAVSLTKKEMMQDYMLYHKDKMDEFNNYMYTVDEVSKKIAKKIANNLIDDVY